MLFWIPVPLSPPPTPPSSLSLYIHNFGHWEGGREKERKEEEKGSTWNSNDFAHGTILHNISIRLCSGALCNAVAPLSLRVLISHITKCSFYSFCSLFNFLFFFMMQRIRAPAARS